MSDTDTTVIYDPPLPEVGECIVLITRDFAAPRAVVWKFFSESEYLAQWFGPVGVHVDPASVAIELHPGGRWDLDMVDDATGEHYPVRSTLRVVTPPAYLEGEMSSRPSGDDPEVVAENVVLRIWLHDHGDSTRLTIHQGPFGQEFRDMTSAGWEASFVKIDALLEGISA